MGRAQRFKRRVGEPSLLQVFRGTNDPEFAQLTLPGFDAAPHLTWPEREAMEELRRGPFALHPHEVEGYADEAHRAYRRRGVPLGWIHHEQLARALGLVALRDPTVATPILDGSLVRLPPLSPRAMRFSVRHECAEHLLRGHPHATHADVQALGVALSVERAEVAAAVASVGRVRAVRLLARAHRWVPWWEIRARISLADACSHWLNP